MGEKYSLRVPEDKSDATARGASHISASFGGRNWPGVVHVKIEYLGNQWSKFKNLGTYGELRI